jgi:hypothetical protein
MYNGQNFPALENPAAKNAMAANVFANFPATWQASASPMIFKSG